jgi:methionyl-tRNA formyltransferase
MDTGDMLGEASIAIEKDDTAASMHDKLVAISPPVLIEAILKIDRGEAEYVVQDESEATEARKLQKADGFINWTNTAVSIHNLLRGVWPWPGGQADFVSAATGKKCRVTIAMAEVVEPAEQLAKCGVVDEELNVICGEGALKISLIKPAGGKLMDFKAFVNGRQVRAGDMFVTIEDQ